MSFTDTISELNFSPVTEEGRGFLPPLGRTAGHFLYLLGRLSDTPTRRPTDLQIQEELTAIELHLNELNIPEYVSNKAQTDMGTFVAAFNNLKTEIPEWDADTKINNLRMLTNRLMQIFAYMDRELLGLRDSDAGQNL